MLHQIQCLLIISDALQHRILRLPPHKQPRHRIILVLALLGSNRRTDRYHRRFRWLLLED